MTRPTTAATKTQNPDAQSERFKQATRELECGEDEARWAEWLKKVAKAKPTLEKSE